jgi:hypothetical protein
MADDIDYRWIKRMMDNQVSHGWTLFALRGLRFQKVGTLDPDMERLILVMT